MVVMKWEHEVMKWYNIAFLSVVEIYRNIFPESQHLILFTWKVVHPVRIILIFLFYILNQDHDHHGQISISDFSPIYEMLLSDCTIFSGVLLQLPWAPLISPFSARHQLGRGKVSSREFKWSRRLWLLTSLSLISIILSGGDDTFLWQQFHQPSTTSQNFNQNM